MRTTQEDVEDVLLNIASFVADDGYAQLVSFFNTERDRLVGEMINNTNPEIHLQIRGKILLLERLADLRSEVAGLIQKM